MAIKRKFPPRVACAVVCPRHVIKDRFGVLTPVH